MNAPLPMANRELLPPSADDAGRWPAAPHGDPLEDDPERPATRAGGTVSFLSTVNVRSLSLAVLAVLACLFAMQWAKAVLIPIALGVMLSYALAPLVNLAFRWRVPRALSATVLLGVLVAALTWGAWTLSDQVGALVDKLPTVTASVRQLAAQHRDGPSTLDKVQRAAAEIEAVASEQSSAAGTARANRAVVVPRTGASAPAFDLRGYLLSGTLGVLTFLGQLMAIVFIALFLLASGPNFRRKMVRLAGPRLSQKKVTIETLDEIAGQIQRYLLVQIIVSAVVGVATWFAFMAIGLQQAAVWGVVAGVTNLIPYLGAVLVGAGSGVVGLVQFGTIEMALVVAGTSFAIHTVVGNVLTPWMTGRASKMSAVAVFIAVLLFGWMWGVWGLLLGVPILMVVKSICDRVEELKPIGELLGA